MRILITRAHILVSSNSFQARCSGTQVSHIGVLYIQALAQKDLDLAAAQKEAREKTTLADKELASVGALDEDNAKLKASLAEANKEVTRLKKDRVSLNNKIEDISRKRNDLEAYLGGLAKKLFLMLEGTFPCPTVLLSLIHHKAIDSLSLRDCRILPKL